MGPQRRIDVVLDSVKRLLRIGATANLLNLLQKQHPADLAQVFGSLHDTERQAVFSLLIDRNGRLAMETVTRFAQLVQSYLDGTYRDFTVLVASARKTTPEKINELAQGRAWSGKDAQARGLVDRLGSFGDAIASAAKLGKLAADPRIEYIETAPGRLQRLLEQFGLAQADLAVPQTGLRAALVGSGLLPPVVQTLAQDLSWLADVAARHKPFAAVVHCLCGVE